MAPPDSFPEMDVSRRELLGGVGTLAVGFGGVVFNGGAVFPSRKLPPYVARQGKLRWELRPLSYKGWTVGEFYDYRPQGGQSADFPVDLSATENASRVFVYDGPVGDSVGFYHGSAEALSGGTAFFKFSGLSRSKGEWAVRDDTTGVDDDFAKWEGGNAKVKWEWGAHETDGGAYWGTIDEKKVKIYPKTLRGVESWRLLSDTNDAGIERIELDQSNPLYIESAERPVRRMEMDVMPGDAKNVFDPYSKQTVTVALRSGAEADPANIDPGNVSTYFGSRSKLAAGSGAQAQNYYRKNGDLFFEFKLQAAGFNLDSDYAYLTTKARDGAWVRGQDAVNPGGVDSGTSKRPLSLYGYNVDATGDDSKNLDGEWVELKNTSGGPLDLTGWTLSDSDSNTYTFPEGFTLPASESVTVHSGSGSDTTNHLYWGASQPVWQNGGDRIVVRNQQGQTVVYHVYPTG